MKKFMLVFLVAFLLPWFSLRPLWAGEIDILLQKLVEKKILTVEEANKVLDETKAQVQKEMKEGKHPTLPKFVQNMEMMGDLRLRYQGERETGNLARHRGRVRLRLGVEAQVANDIKAGFRLASGGTDPRSTNQTFDSFFEHPDIRFDMAYLKYSPIADLTVMGGMFKNPVWETGDMLWDNDINPQGAAISYESKYSPFFMSTGFFILDENKGNTSSPFMVYAQPGVKFDWAKKADLKFAVTGYCFKNIKGSKLKDSAGTNTLDTDGQLVFDYSSVAASAEFGVNEVANFLPRVSVFGDYIYNPDNKNQGFGGGFKFGAKKVKEWGDWSAMYQYKYLEKDAWLDTFPDSDWYGGKTGITGHEGIFEFGLCKNTSFCIDYTYAEYIDTPSVKNVQLLQTDINVKF
jgi:hypothetical protein